jgi:hypothetical protein
MSREDELNRMVEAVIGAHTLLLTYGTPTMQLLSRLLLMEMGVELAARRDGGAANDNPDARCDR